MGEMSPRRKARIAGVFEALEGLSSASGQVLILGRFIVAGNAAATAANILARPSLYTFGFALSFLGVLFHVAWAFLFFELFKPVNRSLSFFALVLSSVGCALQAVTGLLYLGPLVVLQGGSAFSAFTQPQLQALAYLLLRLNARAFDLYLVVFGVWCVVIGYLIFRSRFLPRVLGVLLAVDGVGWALYIVPPLAQHLFPVIAAISALSEFPLQLWLLIVGLNERRWKEQAGAAGQSGGEATVRSNGA